LDVALEVETAAMDDKGYKADKQGGRKGAKGDVSKMATKVSYEEGEKWGVPEISKKLSWLLRRGARAVDIAIDDQGWVLVDDVLNFDGLPPQLTQERLMEVVQHSNAEKLRYEVGVIGGNQKNPCRGREGREGPCQRRIKSSRPS